MRKYLNYIVVLAAIAIVVIGGKKLIALKQHKEASIPVAKTYSLHIKAIKVQPKNNRLTLPYLALTKSNDDVKISSRISARINYIAKSGKRIKKGQVIVKLDQNDLKSKLNALNSQIESKKIALKNMLSTHQRTLELLKVKGASQEQSDKEITNIVTLKAALNGLEQNKIALENTLSYANIKAPVDGVVTRLANIGDIAMMGKPLVSISANSNSYLLIRLPSDIKATAVIFNKKLYKINALNTTSNGLLEYIANIDESVVANQRVDVDIVIYDQKGYMLPHDAILNRDGKSYVLVVKDHKAVAKQVKIVANAQQGVIVDNISNEDMIVVAKQDILLKLLTGINVEVIEE